MRKPEQLNRKIRRFDLGKNILPVAHIAVGDETLSRHRPALLISQLEMCYATPFLNT